MSQAQAVAARENGALSRGPVTAEGKSRSARNSTTHGLNSKVVVLASESPEEYNELLADYLSRYAPVGSAELDLVHEAAAARWRLRRILRMESAIFDAQIERAFAASAETGGSASEAEVFEALTGNSKPLAMLGRYENRIRRSYEKALVELKALQTARKAADTESEQNEPRPGSPRRDVRSPVSLVSPEGEQRSHAIALDAREHALR